VEAGACSVELRRLGRDSDSEHVATLLACLPPFRGSGEDEVHRVLEHVEHIVPETVVESVSQRYAIDLKVALEARDGRVRSEPCSARRERGERSRSSAPRGLGGVTKVNASTADRASALNTTTSFRSRAVGVTRRGTSSSAVNRATAAKAQMT